MIRLPGQLQIAYQEAGGGGVAALGQRANGIVRGSKNLDLPLQQFLLNAQTDLGEHVVQKLMSYAAQLQVLGVLAGVLDGPTEQYRNAIKAAAGSYFEDVITRSQRTSYWENTSPLDGAATAVGYLYKASGLVAGAVGSETWAKKYDDIGNKFITTDPDKVIGNIGLDIMKAIWDSCKQRWDQFWVDFKEKGLLVAYGKLQIDGAFLAAELAIDIALGAVTGGVGAFVGRGLKIIGTRISSIASRVIVRATSTVAKGVPESGILLDVAIPDSQINQRILREILDEDKLGVGSHSDDVAKRAEVPDPAKETPSGGNGDTPQDGTSPRSWRSKEVAGRKVYQRDNLIDPNYVDPTTGLTNRQLMQEGYAPFGSDGKPLNLHHVTQDEPGPMAELLATQHSQNDRLLHIYSNQYDKSWRDKDGVRHRYSSAPPSMDRGPFNAWKKQYWMERAKDFP